jgi:hypothetical protein
MVIYVVYHRFAALCAICFYREGLPVFEWHRSIVAA